MGKLKGPNVKVNAQNASKSGKSGSGKSGSLKGPKTDKHPNNG